MIALIISDVGNPFFTAVTRGVEDVAQQAGYSVLLCNADDGRKKEATYVSVAEQQQVAGVILSPYEPDSNVSLLREAAIPIVTIDRPLNENVDSVTVHSVEGAQAATNHLIDEGWARPACITGPEGTATANQRLEGYLRAIRQHGKLDEIFVHAPYRQHGGFRATAELLDVANPPDAFFVANAQQALGVLQEINRRGLRIGEDIGVITFDDPPWAPFVNPPMSAVAQPAYDIGVQAARLLMERVRGDAPDEARRIVLSTTLVVRESSRKRFVRDSGG